MRRPSNTVWALLLMAGAALLCQGQAAVEYGTAAASKTAGAAAKGVGSAVGKILNKTGDALDGVQRSAARPATVEGTLQKQAAARSAEVKKKEASGIEPTPEAFGKIAVGAPAEELTARLGPPAFRVVAPEEGRLVEIYEYSVKGRDIGTVRVVDGKVAEVRLAGK